MIIEQGIVLGVIVAVVQAIKYTGKVPNVYLPFIAIIIGVMATYLASIEGSSLLFDGIVGGLVASGLWDNAKGIYAGVRAIVK